jgi:hypothetical protein
VEAERRARVLLVGYIVASRLPRMWTPIQSRCTLRRHAKRPLFQPGCGKLDQEASLALSSASIFTWKWALFESRRADSNRLPLLQLRVIIQALQGFAGACKCPISKRFSLLRFATCCTVLRSRWCQSGVKRRSPRLLVARSCLLCIPSSAKAL